MSWQLALFFSIIFGTIRGYTSKKLVNKVDPFVMVFHMLYLSLILYAVYYYFETGIRFILYPEMMILGIIFYLGYIAYLYAARINLSKSIIYSSYYLIITLLLTSIFLGEWRLFDPYNSTGLKNITGIIIAAVSLFIMFSADAKKEKIKDFRWLRLMMFNNLTNGVGSFWAKFFLLNHSPAQTLFSQSVGILPATISANTILKKAVFKIRHDDYFLIILNAILDFLSLIFYYTALKGGPAVLVIPIQTVALTITIALCGLIFFDEAKHFTAVKYAALIMGIIGIIVLVS